MLQDSPMSWSKDARKHVAALERGSKCTFHKFFYVLYSIRVLRPWIRYLSTKLENGPIFSFTMKAVLKKFHGVDVGKYSYGAVLEPGVLPAGSKVGRYCSVGRELIVRRRDHPINRPYMHPFFYNASLGLLDRDSIADVHDNSLEIGHDVWIGDRVTILSGCRSIGTGSVLAAGAVVTSDVPPYSIIGGVPGRIIRSRLDEKTIETLENSAWWERDIVELIGSVDIPNPFIDSIVTSNKG